MDNAEVAKLFNEAMRMGIDLTPLAEWLQSTIDEEKDQRKYGQLSHTTSAEEVVIYGPEDVEILRIDALSENTLADINAAAGHELGRDDLQLWGYLQGTKSSSSTVTNKITQFDRKNGIIYFYLPEVQIASRTRLPTRQQASQHGSNIADMFRQYGLDPSTKYSIRM